MRYVFSTRVSALLPNASLSSVQTFFFLYSLLCSMTFSFLSLYLLACDIFILALGPDHSKTVECFSCLSALQESAGLPVV